jgi:hypothetical protein
MSEIIRVPLNEEIYLVAEWLQVFEDSPVARSYLVYLYESRLL